MVLFPHAKINLGLKVLGKRDDGYHEIETVFLPIPLVDVLEILADAALEPGTIEASYSGLPIPRTGPEDLSLRAMRVLISEHEIPGIRLHLHKAIPMGAGLGGGSSDAAHALRAADTMLGLNTPKDRLAAMALGLGSDVPFFLQDGPCLGSGRGEELRPIDLTLSGHSMILVYPGIHLSTVEVFKRTHPDPVGPSIEQLIGSHVGKWKEGLKNDLCPAAYAMHPLLQDLERSLYSAGAIYACMSGSGSTMFGIFKGHVPELLWPAGFTQWVLEL